MVKRLFSKTIFNSWVLFERHDKCDCSYCHKVKWPVGFWKPPTIAFNSWWVIHFGRRYYFRFTTPFMKSPFSAGIGGDKNG